MRPPFESFTSRVAPTSVAAAFNPIFVVPHGSSVQIGDRIFQATAQTSPLIGDFRGLLVFPFLCATRLT